MSKGEDHMLRPGDRARVRFGHRIVDGTVTSVEGGRIHVALNIDGTDEPVAGLYRESELVPAWMFGPALSRRSGAPATRE